MHQKVFFHRRKTIKCLERGVGILEVLDPFSTLGHFLNYPENVSVVFCKQMGDHAACVPGWMAGGQLGTGRWHVDGSSTEPSS